MSSHSSHSNGSSSMEGHDHGESSSTMDEAMTANASGSFCVGRGTVMQSGFKTSFTNGNCIIWLFPDAVLDTQEKYVVALFGTILLAFCNEGVRWLRSRAAAHQAPFTFLSQSSIFTKELFLAVMFGGQMIIAYALMLLTMTFEYLLFSSIILGLIIGHLTFNYIDARASQHALLKPEPETASNDATLRLNGSTPCCNSA